VNTWSGSLSKAVGVMALLAATVLLATGIYPDGHWNHVTKLTESNYEKFITDNVDSGKTLFIRWIASAG
jgi:hypothetical protein